MKNNIRKNMEDSNNRGFTPVDKGSMDRSRMDSDPKSNIKGKHSGGSVGNMSSGRTMGAPTKDSKHGLHTDHGSSRRSESRRDGSMGSESRDKSNRKNL